MHYADLLFIIHRPITEHDENAQLANVLVFGKNEAYILLLLPVPRSIMMCLFLPQRCERVIIEASKYGYAPIEEHDRARIIQLVHLSYAHHAARQQQHRMRQRKGSAHLVEVRNICDVNEIDNREVLHLLRNRVECLVHGHALAVPVMTEANNNDAIFLGFDGLINVPA